ncbi:uncharacterized protein A4U43_C08F11790 [Asparagus officinalis]|uniref:uncharacterized protein LOC109819657 n=1 Tax=Asparagus officinalis TaxID=4686 RepID=UPI00098DE631|nr:uncharacterized protein LOC109819657 [Asparagus officinalis]ONK59868.1 uncharacterized protein A4U43_C08F11790 [Asparagus officinalis]
MKQRMDHETEFEEEEKASSDCTSGCQSGWTMYFEKSYESKAISMQYHQLQDEEEEEEEEDLSMVSDASSGPPHFRDDDDEHCCCCFPSSAAVPSNNGGKKRRIDTKQDPHSSPLDDTASSPLFSLSKTSCNAIINTNNKNKIFAEDVLELSCGFSATQFKGKSALRKHLGYFKSCAPIKPTSDSREEGEKKKLW